MWSSEYLKGSDVISTSRLLVMGLEHTPSALCPHVPDASERPEACFGFIRMVYKTLEVHRHQMGYPIGTDDVPYIVVTNDLCCKLIQLVAQMTKIDGQIYEGYGDKDWIKTMMDKLLQSYDESETLKEFGLYHSISKTDMLEVYEASVKSSTMS